MEGQGQDETHTCTRRSNRPSTSSSLCPFVSGRNKAMKTQPTSAREVYSQNAPATVYKYIKQVLFSNLLMTYLPALPMESVSVRKVMETSRLNVQLVAVATEVPKLLAHSG